MYREDPISILPGIGEKRARLLAGMGICTVGDLLSHFPRDYDDRSQIKTVSMLQAGVVNTVRGYITGEGENITFPRKKGGAKPLVMTKLRLRDQTGELEIIWFNQPFLKKYFVKEHEYIFTGPVTFEYNRWQMSSPDYERIDGGEALSGGRIVPLYTTVATLSQKTFRNIIKTALDKLQDGFTDDLPAVIREVYALCGRNTAIQHIHFPGCMGESASANSPGADASFLAARRRLVFEELFFMQTALLYIKGGVSGEAGSVFTDTDYTPLLDELPFTPTSAQLRSIATITADLTAGKRMNRLIQGDVGSGKTAVAMTAAYLAVKNGRQAAIMAPTEVLAEQHYRQFTRYLSPLGIKTTLLTGSLPKKERTAALADIASGAAGVCVGTHALLQAGVVYHDLALVVTDEQHRFGVNQRFTLTAKGYKPHTLVMTATPIPRTLALILYGDLDISVIDEMPPGRMPIKTYCVDASYRNRLVAFIKKEISDGRQVYVICPAIDESTSEITNVTSYTRELAEMLPGIPIGMLHGRMKATEKQQIMSDYAANRLSLIVATTVIEVGVDVPNASLMIIENADRFGLSQLHQLRGRVGRGMSQSYCVLVTDCKNEQTRARMKAMTQTTDGFKLSELDLEQRGAGDFFGVRQHGLPSFTIANLYRDMDVLKEAQTAAVAVFRDEISITTEEKERIRQRIESILSYANGDIPL